MLVVSVRLERVTRPKVYRGNPPFAEPGHIGPTVLREHLNTNGGDKLLYERRVKARAGAGRGIPDRHLAFREQVANELGGLPDPPTRRDPVIAGEHCPVGDAVPRTPPGHPDRIEAFPVGDPVTDPRFRLEAGEP